MSLQPPNSVNFIKSNAIVSYARHAQKNLFAPHFFGDFFPSFQHYFEAFMSEIRLLEMCFFRKHHKSTATFNIS